MTNLGTLMDTLTFLDPTSFCNVYLLAAHKHISQPIKSIENMKVKPCPVITIVSSEVTKCEFTGVELIDSSTVKLTNSNQLLQKPGFSLFSPKQRALLMTLLEYCSCIFLCWNQQPNGYNETPRFGDKEMVSLARRRNIDQEEANTGFGLFKVVRGSKVNPALSLLHYAVACIPVSTANCEHCSVR